MRGEGRVKYECRAKRKCFVGSVAVGGFVTEMLFVALKGKENCYYHGRVEEHPDWSVVISTCFGIRYSARSGGA